MALYVGDEYTRFWTETPASRPVTNRQAQPLTNEGYGYESSMATESPMPFTSDPIDNTAPPLDLGTDLGASNYTETNNHSALANLQGLSAAPYQNEKFFSKEDKALFKEIHGTEQELATSVQSLRQTVDSVGKIDAQSKALNQTLAQLNDGIGQLQRAANHPAYQAQQGQIKAKLDELTKQKQDAERTQARLTEERASQMDALAAAKEETRQLADAYTNHMIQVATRYETLKAKTNKAHPDANSVDKAPYLLKQSGAMKKTLNLIAQALDEVEDIEKGQTAPILNTENDPELVNESASHATEETEAAQGQAINDVLTHLQGVAEKKGGLSPKDLDKIKSYLENDGDFTLDDEALRASLKPLVHGETPLSDEGKETYIQTVDYLQSHFETVAKAKKFDDYGFHLGQAITGKDLGAILNEETEALEVLKKDLGGAVGIHPEDSTEDHAEATLTGGEIAGGLVATGTALYGAKKLKDKFGKQAGAAAKSAATSMGNKVSQTQTGQRILGAASRLKNKFTGAKTTTRLEPTLEKATTPGMEKQLKIADGDFTPKKGAVTAPKPIVNKPATPPPGMEKQLKIADGDFTPKKGVVQPPKAPQTLQQPIKAKIQEQLAQKAAKAKLGRRPTPPPKVGVNSRMAKIMSRGGGFVAKAGTLLGSRLNMWVMGLSVIIGVASQAGAVPGKSRESLIPDA